MIVGIDFGTCYSSVAVMMSERPVTSIVKSNSELGIPSMFLHHDGALRYGDDCLLGDVAPYRNDCIEQMKKKVRASPDNIDKFYRSGGKDFILKDIISGYLEYVLKKTMDSVKGDKTFRENPNIEEITVTVPVGIEEGHLSSSDYRTILLNTIRKITGLDSNRIHVIEEPYAAAIAYLYKDGIRTEINQKKRIIVFDLGGGSFDLTLAEYDPREFRCRPLAKDGILELGGNDWDDALYRYVVNKHGIKVDRHDEAKFRDAIVKLKTELSERERYYIEWTDENGDDISPTVTREEFENCTRGLLDRAMDKFGEFVDRYAPNLQGIDNIVLVGGSSNMPQVMNALSAMYSQLINSDKITIYQPSKAIAIGAAIYSSLMATTEEGELVAVDQTSPKTYGIRLTHSEGKKVIRNYIYIGQSYPESGVIMRHRTDVRIKPPRYNTSRIRVPVVESEYEKRDGDKGEFSAGTIEKQCGMELYIPVPESYKNHPDDFKVTITMKLDRNGILRVSSTDVNNNVIEVQQRFEY